MTVTVSGTREPSKEDREEAANSEEGGSTFRMDQMESKGVDLVSKEMILADSNERLDSLLEDHSVDATGGRMPKEIKSASVQATTEKK